ncbi:macrophage migration inhibitory factor homolog [Lycorma delicatula]|uniref:macrophage migration inhibitory factor homolog n=1 Tax=Lycorma delicatula TaxID=130591 RepID=UPI003F510DF4
MPIFRLETNLVKCKLPSDSLQTITKVIATALNKPEEKCSVSILPDQLISFGGSTDLCGNATLLSIGGLGIEENKRISGAIFDHIENHLGIPKNRLYLLFVDAKPSQVGFNGTTLHSVYGGN